MLPSDLMTSVKCNPLGKRHAYHSGGTNYRGREVTGPQAYTYGRIAKQPNSNWHTRLLAIQQRMTDETAKDDEEKMKENQREIIKSKFHTKTNKKCLDTKIRSRVNKCLQAFEKALDSKRERLRDLLLKEERQYVREYITQTEKVSESLHDEQRQKALECRVKRQAEEAALAAEKRLQQYMNRCEELRTFKEALNTKEVAKAVLKQIEDKNLQKKADIELEKMWENLAKKNYDLMVAYEEEEARKRKSKLDEINNVLRNQMKSRELCKEEEKQLKMEERANLDKLKQNMIEEEQLVKRENELKKQRMYVEMEEVKRQSAELRACRQAQEKVLNDMFCQLIEQETKREQDKLQDNKLQMRKESDFFRAYLQETAERKKAIEAEADNLRAQEVAKIEAAKHEQEVKRCEAVLKLKEAVSKGRNEQIKERIKQKEDEMKRMDDEARLAELLRLESLQVNMENKKALEKQQKEYFMDLSKQIENNKQLLLMQYEDEERQLCQSIAKEEAYFNKVKDLMANKCSAECHPFMKKFQGLVI